MKQQQRKTGTRVSMALIVAVAVTAGLRIGGMFLEGGRWWGIDFGAWLGWPLTVAVAALAVLVAAPFLAPTLDGALRKLGGVKPGRVAIAMAAVAVAVTVVFPMRTFFYGDAPILVSQIYRITGGLPHDPGIILNLKSSPLAGVVLYGAIEFIPWLFRGLSIAMPETAAYPFTFIAVLGLAAWAWFTARRQDAVETTTLYLTFFGLAGTLLFFSYIEFYLPVYVCIGLYLHFSMRFLEGRGSAIPAFIAFALAFAAHYLVIALTPSLAFLLYRRYGGDRPAPSTRTLAYVAAGAIALFVVAYLATGMYATDNRIVMPLVPVTTAAGTCSYTLLSSRRLLDLVNLVLLLAPVPALYIIAMAASDRFRNVRSTTVFQFFLITAVFLFAFIFFANTSLGLARDWDITAPFGIVLGMFAWWLARNRGTRDGRRESLVLGLASLVFVIPWIMVNVRQDASVGRFEHIVQLDADVIYPDYALSGYEAIRKYYQHAGNMDMDFFWSKKKIERLGYEQDYTEMITQSQLFQTSNPDLVTSLYQFMLEHLAAKAEEFAAKKIDRDYAITAAQVDHLAELLAFSSYLGGTFPKLEPLLARIQRACPGSNNYQVLKGLEAYKNKDYPRAIEEFQITLNRKFSLPAIYGLMGSALGIEKRFSEALNVYETGLNQFPDNTMLQLVLAQKYISAGIKLDEAIGLLQACRAAEDNADKIREIDQLLLAATQRRQAVNAAR